MSVCPKERTGQYEQHVLWLKTSQCVEESSLFKGCLCFRKLFLPSEVPAVLTNIQFHPTTDVRALRIFFLVWGPFTWSWFSVQWIDSHTHNEKWTDVHACTCKNTHKHHKGKLRQLLGIKYKQPQQTCRQTDDYLHDKDLKYSPQNVFPWSTSTTFHVYLQSCFWHKGYFSKVWKTPALTAAAREPSGFSERPYSCLPSRKPANALQKHTRCAPFMAVVYVYTHTHTQKYTVHLLNSQTHRDKERHTHTQKFKRCGHFLDLNAKTHSLVLHKPMRTSVSINT